MGVPRFYSSQPIGGTGKIALDERCAHHALRVLRLSRGARVQLFDGHGGEYDGVIERASKDAVIVELAEQRLVERESNLRVCVAQALSSGERMDYTLAKCVELGATRFQPVASERSVVRLDAERAVRRREHWQQVVIAACEQCGRNRVPAVGEVAELIAWASTTAASGLRVVLTPQAPATLRALPAPQEEVVVLAGPEGGFTDAEQDVLRRLGFVPVRLGARVLRTETAAAAALAALQTLWGDFS